MRVYTTYFFVFIILIIKAQTWQNVTNSYVNNPSFEEYSDCPQNTSFPPSGYWIDSCFAWSHVTYASPDYLNACANGLFPFTGVPNNIVMTYQNPFEGKAYLGFLAYSLWGDHGEMWCEYVQTQLKQNLISGKKYKFSMWLAPSKNNAYGVSKIGVHFSQSSLSNNYQQTSFKFTPTLLNTKGIIADTSKWFLFEENFIATGLENFITIGWFADTLTSDNGYFDTISNQVIYADTYYAIDSINIFELKNNDFEINIITPNGDGINDGIDFKNYNFKQLNFDVYNRWGNLIFNTSNINSYWDGKNKNSDPLSDGFYYYILNATTTENEEIKKHNFLSIIR